MEINNMEQDSKLTLEKWIEAGDILKNTEQSMDKNIIIIDGKEYGNKGDKIKWKHSYQ